MKRIFKIATPTLCALILASCGSLPHTSPNATNLSYDAMPEPNTPVTLTLTPGTIGVSNWESLGGCTTTTPVGVWTDEANFMVAAKGCDGNLWVKRWNNDVWMNWAPLNVCLNSAPNIAVQPQTRQLVLSYVDCQGAIRLQTSSDAGSTWRNLASRMDTNATTAVTAIWENADDLVVYFVDVDGQINYFNANALNSDAPNIVSGTTTDPKHPKKKPKITTACAQDAIAATSDMAGRVDVVFLSCKKTLSVATSINGVWDFFLPDVAAIKNPDPVAKHIDVVWNTAFPPTLEVFFQGAKNNLFQTSLSNGVWTAPSADPDPTPIVGGISTTNLNVAGEMTMLTNQDDNQIYIKFLIHTNPSSGGVQ